MTPDEARRLYQEARSKRPNLPFVVVPRMAELEHHSLPPSKQKRLQASREKAKRENVFARSPSTQERAERGEAIKRGLSLAKAARLKMNGRAD